MALFKKSAIDLRLASIHGGMNSACTDEHTVRHVAYQIDGHQLMSIIFSTKPLSDKDSNSMLADSFYSFWKYHSDESHEKICHS